MNRKLCSSSIALIAAVVACATGTGLAFAQTSDNSSDLGVPTDNPAADLGLDNSTNSSSPTAATGPASGTATNSSQTSTVTTPEFGSMVPIILVISVMSIVVLSARTRLGIN